MNPAVEILLVALGAGVGAPMRFLVNFWVREHFHGTPAAGTLAVNNLGSFVLGVIVGGGAGASVMALVGIGFCGALTTFSTLALELWDALADERRLEVSLTTALSLILGVGALWLGWALAN